MTAISSLSHATTLPPFLLFIVTVLTISELSTHVYAFAPPSLFTTTQQGTFLPKSHFSSGLYVSSSPSPSAIDMDVNAFLTVEQLETYATNVGVDISITTLGPGYRSVARASHDEKQILGYCEGFVRPAGNILHVDKLEVWKKALDRARESNPEGFQNGGQVFGVSLLLGYRCLLYGHEKGCSVAEFLAIDDEEFQHKRLVRFFKRAGFNPIRYVGDDLASVPDRLVWGGCGTLMNEKIESLLLGWNKVMLR